MDDGTARRKLNKEVTHRYKRSVKLPQKCKFLKANIDKEVFVRRKRDVLSIDPVDANENNENNENIENNEKNEEYTRAKRRVASVLKEYSDCRKNDSDGENCTDVYANILKIADEFSEKFSQMKEWMENLTSYINSVDDSVNDGDTKVGAGHKVIEKFVSCQNHLLQEINIAEISVED